MTSAPAEGTPTLELPLASSEMALAISIIGAIVLDRILALRQSRKLIEASEAGAGAGAVTLAMILARRSALASTPMRSTPHGPEAIGLLQSHPDLKDIISPTTVGIAAAARYLSTSKAKGKVALTGLGTPDQMREFVKDGTVKEFALWNPADLGYLAAYAAKSVITGEIKGNEGDKFTAGKLGEYTVGADKSVVLGDPFKFN